MAKRESTVKFSIVLDENNVPETIHWTAKDGGVENQPAGSMMVAVWDEKAKECLRLDLWTKEMTIDDMKKFFHQTIMSMADTLERATNEEKAAMNMRKYAHNFGLELDLFDK
ncbi:MAG: gliding motility protein GldC [Cryomorphaceae bacterium]|nr:gliding motility protein GldC [Cryomorphaceae bacterium]